MIKSNERNLNTSQIYIEMSILCLSSDLNVLILPHHNIVLGTLLFDALHCLQKQIALLLPP